MINNNTFRDSGIIVNEMNFDSYEKALEYAKANGYSTIIVYENNGISVKGVR